MEQNDRFGILLAGGTGSRLWPLTSSINKQLLPIYDKPLIYYPLTTLMLSGIREIVIICRERDHSSYFELLGDGTHWGIKLDYIFQDQPRGIPEAFLLTSRKYKNRKSLMLLGDNIFHGVGLGTALKDSAPNEGATIFSYSVSNPSDFGIVEIGTNNEIISIAEKPKIPKSNLAITGMYYFDEYAHEYAEKLIPSERGELEITDLLQMYLEKKELSLHRLERGTAWLDTGTHDAMLAASQFVQIIENRQGMKIGCIEEAALRQGFITKKDYDKLISRLPNSSYTNYLKQITID